MNQKAVRKLIHEIFVVKFELPEPSVPFAHRKQEDGVDGLSDYPTAIVFERHELGQVGAAKQIRLPQQRKIRQFAPRASGEALVAGRRDHDVRKRRRQPHRRHQRCLCGAPERFPLWPITFIERRPLRGVDDRVLGHGCGGRFN